MHKLSLYLLLVTFVLFSGCATRESVKATNPALKTAEKKAVVLPFVDPESDVNELTEDMLYHHLLGDIAAQRGDLALSYNHYMFTARLMEQSGPARSATRIALFRKNYGDALKAAERWIKYAPNSIAARSTAAVLQLRMAQPEIAMEHFQAVVRIADALGKDGFLLTAVTLSKENSLTGREAIIQSLVDQYPDDERSHYAQAVFLGAQKKHELTLQALGRALQIKPNMLKARLFKVKVFIEQGDVDKTLGYLNDMLADYPENVDIRLIRAKLLLPRDKKLAYKTFEAVLQLDPANSEALSALGIIAIQFEDISASRVWWGRLLEHEGEDERSLAAFHLGQLEEFEDNFEKASEYYARVSSGKFKSEARLRYAKLQAELGNLDAARAMLKSMRVVDPENAVDYYLTEAQLLHEKESKEAVVEFYQSALKGREDNIDLRYSRGVYFANLGDVIAAEDDLRFVLSKKPDHADALNALGYTLTDLTSRHQEALQLIMQAFKLKPDSAAVLDSMGWVYFRLGELEKARSFLQQALDIANDDEIAAHFIEVLWGLNEKQLARAEWRKANKAFPDSKKLLDVSQRLGITSR